MSLSQIQAEDRRKIILSILEKSDYHAGELVLKQVVESFGHRPSREQLRGDLIFLETNTLIRIERIPGESGEFWVAHLLADGRDVARGRSYPGVARAEPT